MTIMRIPDSVLSYSNNEGVRVAVDHLVNADPSDFPTEITSWDEARSYHKALLSAHQVQAERAVLLMDLWDTIWGELIKERNYTGLLVSYQQQHSKDHYLLSPPSPNALWNDSAIHTRIMKHPVLPNTFVYLGTRYLSAGIQIFLSVEDDDDTPSTNWTLPSPWAAEEDDESFRYTVEGYLAPTEPETDLAPLIKAGSSALNILDADKV